MAKRCVYVCMCVCVDDGVYEKICLGLKVREELECYRCIAYYIDC